ncbi:hypothetical protein Asp14428_36730 [Actinoplanes sp. NBRC 14428]|uniref:HEAT repeat protein n=1 Tax=Pseudosporangium ferrugineum TaxID=439699 RepID=A0A2T0S3U5_9ACTN|nr:hypothetical protein [Pseudosporangium ferrugineum]PRY28072.1 hypothetical protein CLV70_109229 [Pseudosporangium ferrugineum]BCJ52198.1 hypothetical protein Asp14428_36730 [Actinoplanes sp. NBRC 14428]
MTEDPPLDQRRAEWAEDLTNSDVAVSTRALLALTYEDPDRRRVEQILLDCLRPAVDPQLRALAVTCMGHVGRLHGAVSPDIVTRLRGLLSDPALGGRAEDALDDIASFVGLKGDAEPG